MSRRRVASRMAYIGPAFGGGGGAFGKGASGGTESPDNLRSRQTAKLVDLIGEGPNVGIVGFTKGIFYDGVPLQNQDGTFNFSNAVIQEVLGLPDQPVMNGFNSVDNPGNMGSRQQLKYGLPVEKTISDTTVDRVRFTFSVNSLQTISDEGDISGATVEFGIRINNNGGGFADRGTYKITGKTSSGYQRDIVLTLPAPGPWILQVRRITADSTSTKLINDLFWDGFQEVTDLKVNYTLSHCVGTIIDAEQFGSIPSRTYLVDGRKIQIPNNYDPIRRTYAAGGWDGNFTIGWSNNPAWCLYDMITHNRYGLGSYFAKQDPAHPTTFYNGLLVDKWSLYEIGQWCDGAVPDGHGGTGTEPRFVCNAVISNQAEAFALINQMAAIFRGFLYWSGGQMIAVADKPRLPVPASTAIPNVVGIFSPANVINGTFTYAGADLRSRHNQVTARWLDGDHLGEERYAIAEDQPSISKYGIMSASIDVLGATHEAQAVRSAKWMIYTDTYEGEVVDFSVGLSGAWMKPGDIIGVADPTIGGERRGGRVWGGTSSRIELDSTVTIAANFTGYLTCLIGGDGDDAMTAETMRVTSITNANGRSTLSLFNAFHGTPKPGSPWLLSTDDLMPTLWRVITLQENDDGTYGVNAVAHNPTKWDAIEKGKQLVQPDISNIQLVPPAVTDLKVVESLVVVNVSSVGVVALLSWKSDAPYWDIDARKENGNWQRFRAVNSAFEVQVTEGKWEFQVTPVSLLGRKGGVKSITKNIVGRYAAPKKPENFRVVIQNGVALFRWSPSTEVDVKVGGHFELRHSPRLDGSARWENATPIIESIAGASSDASAFYQAGTWFLRTFDIVGLQSAEVAVVVTMETDLNYQAWARICEQPAWQGTHDHTVVEDHSGEKWLVIDYGGFGGLWNAQTDNMDDWPPPAVDVLPGGTPWGPGTYKFFNRIDMGGIFPTRLTLDMLSAPYFPGTESIDQRFGSVDDWLDWDNNSTDLTGTVRIEMRKTNNDPKLGTAVWSDWAPFTAGDQTGWGFEFRAILTAPVGQNVAVQELCILADVSNKIDENKYPDSGGVKYTGTKLPVIFNIKFQQVPAITVTLQNAQSGDRVVVTNKKSTGFDIELFNGNTPLGTPAAPRLFDWHAMGY